MKPGTSCRVTIGRASGARFRGGTPAGSDAHLGSAGQLLARGLYAIKGCPQCLRSVFSGIECMLLSRVISVNQFAEFIAPDIRMVDIGGRVQGEVSASPGV